MSILALNYTFFGCNRLEVLFSNKAIWFCISEITFGDVQQVIFLALNLEPDPTKYFRHKLTERLIHIKVNKMHFQWFLVKHLIFSSKLILGCHSFTSLSLLGYWIKCRYILTQGIYKLNRNLALINKKFSVYMYDKMNTCRGSKCFRISIYVQPLFHLL